ncbi:MAG: hypothetical protein KJ767_00630 [Nanoarchaeota archaeon]|nr:hypothetical protein [Nanoarchaeota archaeon]
MLSEQHYKKCKERFGDEYKELNDWIDKVEREKPYLYPIMHRKEKHHIQGILKAIELNRQEKFETKYEDGEIKKVLERHILDDFQNLFSVPNDYEYHGGFWDNYYAFLKMQASYTE